MGTGTSRGEPDIAARVPDGVRRLLVARAADVLGELDATLVPASLERVRTFAPRRRASSGAVPLWRALVDDDGFRLAVAAAWARDARTTRTPSADAADRRPQELRDAAAEAFLRRPDGWQDAVERARAADDSASAARRERTDLERLRAENDRLASHLAEVRGGLESARAYVDELTAELAATRREQRRLRADADRARAEARTAREEARAERSVAEEERAAAHEARRAASADLARARAERDAARHARSADSELATARARLLLDTVVDAAAGLRRELALGPATTSPAADVAARLGVALPVGRPGSRGRSADDPALLDDLLAVPRTHLVVDGYNVTKAGFGELTLAEQRERLVTGLLRVASTTGSEVTCCFDGAATGGRAVVAPRGVRVLFSSGEIADDLIRRLVAAEPPGRPVVVVTSDRAVADDVEAMGAVSVPSTALLARLSRR